MYPSRQIVCALILSFLAGSALAAPLPPTNVAVRWHSWGSPDYYGAPSIRITWVPPAGTAKPYDYRLFYAKGVVSSAADTNAGWKSWDAMSNDSAAVTAVPSIDTMTFYMETRQAAKNGNDTTGWVTSGPSNLAVLTMPPDASMRLAFTSSPNTEQSIDSGFYYRPTVSGLSPGLSANYHLFIGPRGMTIASGGGSPPLVEFGPQDTGLFPVVLGADDGNERFGIQRFVLHVIVTPRDSGIVTGTITDSGTGLPIAGAMFSVPLARLSTVAAITDTLGVYTVTLRAGCYDVAASATGYVSKSYRSPDTSHGCLRVVAHTTMKLDFALVRDVHATLTLTIRNRAGAGIRYPFATANRVGDDRDSMGPGSDGYGNASFGYGDTDGIATITLMPGWYQVSITASGFTPIWLDSASDRAHARFIRVHANDSLVETVVMAPYVYPTYRTVSGTLRAMAGGAIVPVRYGSVSIATFGDGVPNGRSDTSGRWSMQILDGTRIALRADARGYLHSYWQGHTSVLDADSITVTSDTSGFDFLLTPAPTSATDLAGIVSRCEPGYRSRWVNVIFYRIVNGIATAYATINADSDGSYSFAGVEPGSYFISAIAPGSFVESYHTATGACSSDWHDAATVTIADSMAIGNLNIGLIAIADSGGSGVMNGTAIDVTGGAAGGSVPARGVVNAWNGGGKIAGRSPTDASGAFRISRLMPGDYSLTFDRPGYRAVSLPTATIKQDGSQSAPIQVVVTRELIESIGERPLAPTFSALTNFPNPFIDATTIDFSISESGPVKLDLYDLHGTRVAELASGMRAAGATQLRLDASSLRSGVYFLRLRSRTGIGQRVISVTK